MFKGKLTERATQVRFFRFLVVGASSAIVQFCVLAISKTFLPPRVAFSVSFGVAMFVHYGLNRFWALRSVRLDTHRQFGEYILTVCVSYVLNLTAFALGHEWFGLSVMWAAALAVPPSTLAVFLILNFRVFRAPALPPRG